MAILFNCLSIKAEMISVIGVRVSVAQVVKAWGSRYMNKLLLSVDSIPARGKYFFRMRVVRIANFKTYLKNVFVALSRNAPNVYISLYLNNKKQ